MVVTGGGTGGHFFPAMAIRNALQEKGVEVKYIGSKFGVEATQFSNNSENELLMNIRGIQRQLNFCFAWDLSIICIAFRTGFPVKIGFFFSNELQHLCRQYR